MIRIKILYFVVGLFLLSACAKGDKSALNDYELFNRLQSGSGKWKVIQYEKWDNTQNGPSITTEIPSDYFYHFYFKSVDLPGGAFAYESGDFYVNGALNFSSKVEAETERISFPAGLGEGEVWTVEVNKINKQVWTRMNGSEAVRITLERCNCNLPNAPGETGG